MTAHLLATTRAIVRRPVRIVVLLIALGAFGAAVVSSGGIELVDAAIWAGALTTIGLVLYEWRASERRAVALLDELAAAGHTATFSGLLHPDLSYVEDVAVLAGVAGILGLPSHEVTAESWMAAVLPEDVHLHMESRAALRRGEAAEFEYRLRNAAGELRVIWERTAPVTWVTPDVVRITGVLTDVTDRRLAEDQLAGERVRLARILASVDEVVATLVVSADGRLTEADGGTALDTLLGVGAGDVVERWREGVHPEDLASFLASIEDMRGGRATAREYRFSGPDGPMRWLWVRTSPRTGVDGRQLVDVVASDTTERRRLATELSEARSQLQEALESVDAAFYTLLVDDHGAVELLYTSAGWARIVDALDGTPAERGRRLLGLVHADDRVFYEQGNHQLADGEAIDRTFRIVGSDGAVRFLQDRARPRTRLDGLEVVDGVLVDVTRSRRAEVALSEAQEDLERIVESIDELLWRSELGADGVWRTVYAGPGGAAFLGVPEAITRDLSATDVLWIDAVVAEDRDRYLAAWGAMSASTPLEVDYRVRGRDGGERWLLDRAKARFSADGALIADGITIDITEQRLITDELERLRTGVERLSTSFGVFHYRSEFDEDGHETSVQVSTGWREFLGEQAAPHEMARQWLAAVHPDDLAAYLAGDAEIAAGHRVEQRYRLRATDGTTRWILDRCSPSVGVDGRITADGVVMDITAQVQAEQERDAARAHLAAIAARVDVGFYTSTWNEGRWAATFHLGSWDPTDGAEPGHAAFAAWFERVHPDDRRLVEDAVAKAIVGQTDDLVYRLLVDGDVRWIVDRARARERVAGEPSTIDGIVVDVTAAVTLASGGVLGDRAAAALGAADVHYVEARVTPGGPVLAGDAGLLCRSLLGATLPDGLDLLALVYAAVPAEVRPGIVSSLRAVVERGERRSGAVPLVGLDGVTRTFDVSAAAAPTGTGVVVSLVIVPQRRETVARIEALLDAIDEVVREDALAPDGSWSIVVGHERFGSLLGIAGSRLDVERAYTTAIVADDRPLVEAHRVRLAAGRSSNVEYRTTRADGAVRVLWERARPRVSDGRLIALSITADVTAWHPDGAVDRVGPHRAGLS